MLLDLSSLRRNIRHQRRRISIYQQRQTEQNVLALLRKHPIFQSAKHIGLYLNAFGEVSTRRIIQLCFKLGKQVYLPRICPMNQHLHWVRIHSTQQDTRRFNLHRLGMLEPMQGRGRHIQGLDLLIMPLLACDPFGTRIGMGGGYYDKTLSQAPKRPFRLGLAHEFQFIENKLPRQPWDQPLDALLTPQKIRRFHRI